MMASEALTIGSRAFGLALKPLGLGLLYSIIKRLLAMLMDVHCFVRRSEWPVVLNDNGFDAGWWFLVHVSLLRHCQVVFALRS